MKTEGIEPEESKINPIGEYRDGPMEAPHIYIDVFRHSEEFVQVMWCP